MIDWKYEMKNPILYTVFVIFYITPNINVGEYCDMVFRISANMSGIFIQRYYILKNVIRILQKTKEKRLVSTKEGDLKENEKNDYSYAGSK